MELRETASEHGVLNLGQDLVADVLVKRHSPSPGCAWLHHPGAKDRVRMSLEDWLDKLFYALGGILTVGVQKDDDVETFVNGDLIAGLLVAAIASVFDVTDHSGVDMWVAVSPICPLLKGVIV